MRNTGDNGSRPRRDGLRSADGESVRAVSYGGSTITTVALGPFRVSEVAYESGLRQVPHRHDRACLTYVLDGGFTETIAGDSRPCRRNHVLLKPAGLRHSCGDSDSGSLCLSIEIATRDLGALGPVRAIWSRPGYLDGAPMERLAARIREELHANDAAASLALEGLCLELLAAVYRHSVRPRGQPEPAWIADAICFLRERIASKVSIADVAARVGVPDDVVAREFRRHRGEPIRNFLRCLRLERARELLRDSPLSLAEVATAVGFFDQSHFTRVFRESIGTTPGVYRRSGDGNRREA